MTRRPEARKRGGSSVRTSALGVGVLLGATLCFTLGGNGVGNASEPTDTSAPTDTASAVVSAPPSTAATSTDAPTAATPTGVPATEPATSISTAAPAPTGPTVPPVASTSPGNRGVTGHTATPRSVQRANAVAVPASAYLVLTANSLDAIGLSYVGTVIVAGPSGDVEVLRFSMRSGSFAGLHLVQACSGGASTVTDAPSADLTAASFDAVRLDVTAGATPLTYTAGNPPAAGFPSEIVLQDITLTATTMSVGTLTMPSFSTQAATC